jgi:hypothetical protein
MDMYFPVDLESAKAPMVMVAAAGKTNEKVIGVCMPIGPSLVTFSFGTPAQHYLILYDGKDPMDVDISRVEIRFLDIVRQPEHGRLIMDENSSYGGGAYDPDEGYLGKDRVEAIVAVGDDVIRVVMNFIIQTESVDQILDHEWKKLCPKGLFQKISGAPAGNDTDPVSWYRANSLQALLAGLDDFAFSDLPGASLGPTPGDKITLDAARKVGVSLRTPTFRHDRSTGKSTNHITPS